ncbi:FAD binding domain containing protein [Acanthamoeba castellanii str. Neff]|uniref:FAD binding domain containing protein n=1 Tax=Acanthamoeba castellanii (strain ATCC 30010 / Neff) TaxID=1257118 RepID=L8HGF7_ACACF|nr:FAD binding domain containing protein [Acanthamoeba castellanii str. Neff]ELR24599.1 FAD binding domain containing protein [Acanthamoeba castellanii str. Neff]
MPEGSLAQLRFGVFGLGNKNTRHDFNNAAKKLHAKLLALGATDVHKLGLGCELDPDGHYTAFVPWMIGFFSGIVSDAEKEALEKNPLHISSALYKVTEQPAPELSESMSSSRRVERKRGAPPGYTYVKLKRNKKVTPENYIRRIYRADISLKHTDLNYEVGDHISILPQNDVGSVSAFMRFYDLDPTASLTITPILEGLPPLKITQPLTVSELLTKYLDLFGRPTKHLIRFIAQSLSPAEKQKLQLLIDDPVAWESFQAEFPSACDILLRYSSVRLTLAELVTFIPLIRPRLYSMISCPQLRLIYLCREWRAPGGRTVKGLATSYLSRLKRKHDLLAVKIQKGVFRYDEQKAKAPLMFVALGTGVATAISLLHLRKAMLDQGATVGSMVLFYGCRHKDQDFLFQKELDQFVQTGVLNQVVSAFSHDQEERVFVQDKIREKKELVASYVQHKDALYYYCGLGGVVPFLVEEAIGEAIVTMGKSQHEAEALITEMRSEQRWFVEAYSATLTKNLELEVIEKHDVEEVRAPVIFSEKGSLRAGSLEKVIEWVCSKPLTGDNRNEIWSDRDAFLLCYRQYCTPEQLLEKITSLYVFAPSRHPPLISSL